MTIYLIIIKLIKGIPASRVFILLLLSFTFFGQFNQTALALSADQKQLFDSGIYYFNSEPSTSGGSNCNTGTTLSGGDNIQQALNFLIGKGLPLQAAAGIIGNLEQESGQGLNPHDDQLKGTADEPTPNDGFGIAQWTTPDRQQGLVVLAQQEGGQPADLAVQLDYLWQELTASYQSVLQSLKATNDVDSAVNIFVGPDDINGQPVPPTYEGQRTGGYENPGNPVMTNRLQHANDVVDNYGSSTSNNQSGCSATSAANCNSQSASNTDGLSPLRQEVVCLAQQELALWQSQPGYNSPYPGFAYAATGLLKYTGGTCSGNTCTGSVYQEWCADFVSWVYNQAGYPFSGGSNGGWMLPAVDSIQTLGEQDQNFHWHPASSNYVPKPGDIAIHTIGESHTNIFVSSSGGTSTYIGGDQSGVGEPDGTYGTQNPPSGSVVSTETDAGYYGGGISGYVSPD